MPNGQCTVCGEWDIDDLHRCAKPAGPEDQKIYDAIAANYHEPQCGDEMAVMLLDAARYRWLVENSFDREGETQLHVWLHTWEPHSQTGEPTEWKQRVRGPAIDRVIDAAMGQAPNASYPPNDQ